MTCTVTGVKMMTLADQSYHATDYPVGHLSTFQWGLCIILKKKIGKQKTHTCTCIISKFKFDSLSKSNDFQNIQISLLAKCVKWKMQCFNDIFETKCPNKLFQAKNLKLLSKLDIFLSKLFTTRPNFTVNSLLVL